MKRLTKLILTMAVALGVTNVSWSQCATWNDSPRKDEAESAHTIYRQALKTNDYELAWSNWETAYTIAPAADGKRDYHFLDGAKLHLEKFKTEADAEAKKQLSKRALELYDEAIACYQAGTITLSSCGNNQSCYDTRMAFVSGRKAYDMYYIYNTPYTQTLEALKLAVDKGGNSTEYIVFDPYAAIVVYQFKNGKMTKEEARNVYEGLNAIADYNKENNKQLGSYYEQAQQAMNAKFAEIESDIFDCDFFISKLKPEYDEAPNDIEVLKRVYAKLNAQGCTTDIPFYAELEAKWTKYVAEENARIQAEFEANNPSVAAKRLYDEGDFNGAIEKYREAIEKETDDEKKAGYLFSLASIQFRKLNQYSTARNTAYEAAKLRPGWGRPYMLIGDMYASGARNCGDSWNQRLAILAAMDKYGYAKSIDPEIADEASDRLSKYYGSMPIIDDGFQRGISEGQTVKVSCWIGETVKVRFKK